MRRSEPAIVLAHCRAEVVDALTRRRHHLGLSQLDLDAKAGFHLGYTGKLECPDGKTRKGKRWGRACIHPMFDLWIQSLGVGVAIVPLKHVRRARPRHAAQLVLPLPLPEPPPEPGENMVVAASHGGTVGAQPTHVNTEDRPSADAKAARPKKRRAA